MNQKIVQLKEESFKNIKNRSVEIAIKSIEHLLKNSIDKTKLDNLYLKNLSEIKSFLQKKTI